MGDGTRTPFYSVEPYTIEAMPAALELARRVLGEGPSKPKSEGFWRWKHHHNPFGESQGFYAWDPESQHLIGLRIMMRWAFELDGERLAAARAVDTATHPAYRRQGIFSVLTRQALKEMGRDGVSLIFNTPNRETSLPGYLKLGWRVVARWPLYVRVLKPGRMATGPLWRRQAGDGLLRFDEVFGRGILPWQTFEERYGAVLEGFLMDWDRSRARIGLRTPRDVTYLRWRYGGHPHVPYGVHPMEDGEGLAGLAIVRPNHRNGLREVVLTELFLRQPETGLGRALLQGLLAQLKGDYVIAHFSEGTLERALLGAARFLRVPGQAILFTACALGQPPLDPLLPENWDLSLGDLEVF